MKKIFVKAGNVPFVTAQAFLNAFERNSAIKDYKILCAYEMASGNDTAFENRVFFISLDCDEKGYNEILYAFSQQKCEKIAAFEETIDSENKAQSFKVLVAEGKNPEALFHDCLDDIVSWNKKVNIACFAVMEKGNFVDKVYIVGVVKDEETQKAIVKQSYAFFRTTPKFNFAKEL